MKLYQYFKNVSLLFLVNFSIKPLWVFGIESKFQLILGQASYGKYFSYLSIIYILSVFLDLGLHNYTAKRIAESHTGSVKDVSDFVFSKLVLIGIYILLVLISLSLQCPSLEDKIIFFLLGLNQLLFSLIIFGRSMVQGLQELKKDSILSSLDRFFLVIFGFILLHFFYQNISIYSFLLVHTISFSICILVIAWILKSKVSFHRSSFSLSQLSLIFKDGYLLILVYILMTIYSRVDAIFLKNLFPNGDALCGVLAFSFRIIDSAYNALMLMSVFLLPSVAYEFSHKNFDYIRKLVLLSFGGVTLISLGFIGLCYWQNEWIYRTLYKTSDFTTLSVFKIQLLSVLGVGWMYIFGSYLTAIGRFVELVWIVLIGVILSISLNLFLVSKMEVIGSAITSTVVQLTMGILHLVVAFYFLFKYENK